MSRTQDPEGILARLEAATASAREVTREANGVRKDLLLAIKTAKETFAVLGDASINKHVKDEIEQLKQYLTQSKAQAERAVLYELRKMHELVKQRNEEERARRRDFGAPPGLADLSDNARAIIAALESLDRGLEKEARK